MTTNTSRFTNLSSKLFLALGLLLNLIASTRAGTHVWSGVALGNRNWSNPVNWSFGGPPVAGETAPVVIVLPTGSAAEGTNDIAGLTVDRMQFNGPGFSVHGAAGVALTLRGGANVTNLVSNGAGQNLLGSSLDVVLSGDCVVKPEAGTLAIAGEVRGAGRLTKDGAGTLAFSGSQANTYTGETWLIDGTLLLSRQMLILNDGWVGRVSVPGALMISSGTVRLGADDNLGDLAPITINSSGDLDLADHSDTVGALTLNGGDITTGAGLLTLNGNISANAAANASIISGQLSLGDASRVFAVADNAVLSISADISSGGSGIGLSGFGKTGNGLLQLFGANTFSGSVSVNAGELVAGHFSALGSTIRGTFLAPGAVLGLMNSASIGAEALTVNGGTLVSVGTNSWAGDITLNATLVTSNTAPNGEMVLHGVMSGAGGLTHRGMGKLRLGGSTENTFTGATTLAAGVLELDKSGMATAIPGALVVGDGVGGNFSDLVHFRRSDQIADGSLVTVSASGKLDLDGQSDTIGELTLSGGGVYTDSGILTLGGNVNVTASAAMFGNVALGDSSRTFTVADGAMLTLTAAIQTSALNVGLTKIGSGTLGLFGANNHGGPTLINGGEVIVGHPSALGATLAGTAVNNNARLTVGGGRTIVGEPLTLNSGEFFSSQNTNEWTGTVTLLGTNSIIVDLPATQLEFSGLMSGPGGWHKGGEGTLLLSGTNGPNTYAGESWVTNGTLLLLKVFMDANGVHGTNAIPGVLRVGNGWDYGIPTFVRELQDHQLSDNAVVVLHKDATLDLYNNSDTVGSLEMRGGVIETGTGLLTVNGDVRSPGYSDESVIRGRLHLGSQPREFYADITTEVIIEARISGAASASVTKTGSGQFSLSGSNSFAGPVIVSGGWLEVRHDHALGDTDNGIEVNGYGGLQLGNGVHIAGESLAVQGAGGSGYGALLVANNAQASWSGAISLLGDTTMQALGSIARLTLDGPITGAGDLLLNDWGTGTIVFGGAQDNVFNGTTEIRTGMLLLEKTAGFTAVPGPLICGEPGFAENCLVQWRHANQLANTAPVTVNLSGRLDLNDYSDAIGELILRGGVVETGTGTLTLGGDVTAEKGGGFLFGKLSLGGVTRGFRISDNYLHVGAAITDGGGNAGLTKTGKGTLNLGASNTFSGPVLVQDGALRVNHPQALGETTAGTTVSGGGQMLIQGGAWTFGPEALTLDSTNSFEGALRIYDNITWIGSITFARDSAIRVEGYGASHTFTALGAISGPGGFTLLGSGQMILGGNAPNTFAGTSHVAEGWLDLNKNNGAIAIPGALIVGVPDQAPGHDTVRLLKPGQIGDDSVVVLEFSGVLHLNAHDEIIGSLGGRGQVWLGTATLAAGRNNVFSEFSGALLGAAPATLIKQGSGVMTLSGNNSLTYIGEMRVNAGKLLVNGPIAASPALVNAGATLGGHGAVGVITVTGGKLSPGNSPGALQSQNLQLNNAATFRTELNGPTPGVGHDTVNVFGTVNLGNATLDASLGYAGAVGQQFVLFNNDGNEPVTGTFAGFAEGAHMFLNGAEFALSYHGGSDGNDVVLTQLSVSPNFATLAIEPLTAQQVRLSWSTNATGFQVETTTSLPAGNWQPVPGSPVVAADKFTLTLAATNASGFFRLVKP